MSFRDKFTLMADRNRRSACKTEAEREREVFVIREDPVTGKYKGETICCDAALPAKDYIVESSAA